MRHMLLIAALFSCLAACSPHLGDGCKRDTDCSINLDRQCDTSQPGGYCTIQDCEPGACTNEGICVRFQPDDPRLARSWCMEKCSKTPDCGRNRYVCRNTTELNAAGSQTSDSSNMGRVAEVLDTNKNGKFCVVRQEATTIPDAGTSGAGDGGGDGAAADGGKD